MTRQIVLGKGDIYTFADCPNRRVPWNIDECFFKGHDIGSCDQIRKDGYCPRGYVG